MLRVDQAEEVFFDTADCLIPEELVTTEDLANSSYEVWLNEPLSVKERRESFLCRMGFVENYSLALGDINESENMRVARITECSGAVSNSSCESFSFSLDEDLLCERRGMSEGNCMSEPLDQNPCDELNVGLVSEHSEGSSSERCDYQEETNHAKVCDNVDMRKKKTKRWWKRLVRKMKKSRDADLSDVQMLFADAGEVARMKVQQNRKRYMELAAVYAGQEIHAHAGLIWTMKFSPDGKYLASGGEDGVIRIWRVTSADASCKAAECTLNNNEIYDKYGFRSKKSGHVSAVIPDKILKIEESALQELHGHSDDILDLAWATSNHLLSSSKDKTVRLWQVGSNECHGVFRHSDYVTCIQFDPSDENHFISGSIDGKVRLWGVREKRVLDWADVRDIITAICYHPNGKDFVVGSVAGTCRFYEASPSGLLMNAEIHLDGKKRSSGNRITGVQFLENYSQRVMITSEDSKIRILDGLEVVHKYRGLTKSGSQMSASFTSTGRHIISVGEDSRVYVWNYDDFCIHSSKHTKSVRSCEHFFFEGVSVAIPYPGTGVEQKNICDSPCSCLQAQNCQEVSSLARESERFSLANWFSMDSSSRATWPEEKLPLWDIPSTELDSQACDKHESQLHQHYCKNHDSRILPETWGLVIVTAGWDGIIRTFHNYGLPFRM